jgi:pimeloyl-ACP methyl ester carboxylesterase
MSIPTRATSPASSTSTVSRPTPARPASPWPGSSLDRFHELFCPDVPAPQAARLATTQRPATQEALVEPSGERPLWKELPSWFLIGEQDHIIPAALQHFMADRAVAQRTIEIPGASHAITVSQPEATAQLILEAAMSPVHA